MPEVIGMVVNGVGVEITLAPVLEVGNDNISEYVPVLAGCEKLTDVGVSDAAGELSRLLDAAPAEETAGVVSVIGVTATDVGVSEALDEAIDALPADDMLEGVLNAIGVTVTVVKDSAGVLRLIGVTGAVVKDSAGVLRLIEVTGTVVSDSVGDEKLAMEDCDTAVALGVLGIVTGVTVTLVRDSGVLETPAAVEEALATG